MKNIINKVISFLLSNSPENPKKKIDQSLVELFGIIAALSIIFLIWFNYPSFISWMDKPSLKVQIPLLPSAMVPEVLNPQDFHKVGEKFGTYGDAYGSLNTLFSGFAFAILIISLFMQRQELKEQRKELAAQREEISKSNEIAEQQRIITEQQATLIQQQVQDAQRQNFTSIFFKYLEEKKDKENKLIILGNQPIRGALCFKQYSSYLNTICSQYSPLFSQILDNKSRNQKVQITLNHEFHSTEINSNYLFLKSNYFIFFEFIIKFIETHEYLINSNEQVEILLSYTTQDELLCLLWYALTRFDLTILIKKYKIHEYINYASVPSIHKYLKPYYED